MRFLDDMPSRYGPRLCRGAAYVASLLAAAPFLYHLALESPAYLGLLEDDYFYYAIIADKLVTLGKLTYDGTTLTNGFHPLWFGLIVALRAIFGRFGAGFYVALTLVSVASMIATYELGRRLARRLGASNPLSAAVAVTYAVGTGRLLTTGMECVIAVPLFLWLLVEVALPEPVTPRRAAKIGFIASLAILGRIDIGTAVALMIGGFLILVRPRLAVLWRVLLAFCLAGILVPVYAAANWIYFSSPLPMSGLAKHLYTSPGFNVKYATIVALGTVYGPTIGLVLPAGLLAAFLLLRREAREKPAGRFAGTLAVVFAFVFFGLNALTGWTFFGWYAYPLAAATIAAQVFVCQRWGTLLPNRLQVVVASLLVALVPVMAVRDYVERGPRWSVTDNTLLAMSYDLSDRLRSHEGLFAMGAVAGVATYVLDKPVLQLEGIVADRQLIDYIRSEAPLDEVLRAYRADYLIVSFAHQRAESSGGCYLITQPSAEWAGERAAKMRGQICSAPMTRFVRKKGPNPWSRFPTVETLVWDLSRARWKGSEGARVGE
jgi:hypothetical protein